MTPGRAVPESEGYIYMQEKVFSMEMKNASVYALAAALALGFAGCKKEEKKEVPMPPVPVVLSPAVQKDVHRFISSVGTMAALQSVDIVPRVTGQIVSVNFKQGEPVREGDVIAKIDPRQYEANVLAAEAQLKKAETQLSIDELEVERNRKLAESNYVDKQTFDSYVARVEADKAVVMAAKADLQLARLNLEWCTIKAPVSGKAGLFNLDVGNLVTANSPSSLITTIEHVDSLYVNLIIPAHLRHDVEKVMKQRGGALEADVSYMEKGFEKYSRKAPVGIVENSNRYQASTVVLRGVMENGDGLFWPRQSVKVRLNTEEVKGGVLVPNSSIQIDKTGNYAYVADKVEGTMIYRIRKAPVELVQQYPDGSYLVKGLKGGDNVVCYGQLLIAQGALVYSAIPQGAPIGSDGKPIADPQKVAEFMGLVTKQKLELLEKAKLAAASAAPAGASK